MFHNDSIKTEGTCNQTSDGVIIDFQSDAQKIIDYTSLKHGSAYPYRFKMLVALKFDGNSREK